MTREVQLGLLVLAPLATLGILLATQQAPAAERDRSALGRLLDLRGPVRRIVETQTQEGGSPLLGNGRTRTVTEVAQDGRSARVMSLQTYRRRNGETTTDRTEKRYQVTGTPGHEVVRSLFSTSDFRTETVSVFAGACVVREKERFVGKLGSHESVTETKCDADGRLLSQVMRQDGVEISRASYRWFSGRVAFARQWNAAMGTRPAEEHGGLGWLDAHGNLLGVWSSLANLREHYTYDQKGNWVWHKSEMTPTPLAGNNVYVREIAYWGE